MTEKNEVAVALGKLAKGKKKTLTEQQRQKLVEAMAAAREKRWPKNKEDKK
jgi:hypothetical protein